MTQFYKRRLFFAANTLERRTFQQWEKRKSEYARLVTTLHYSLKFVYG